MISLQEFKKILNQKNIQLPDDKIEILREAMDTLADKIFDDWLKHMSDLEAVNSSNGDNEVNCKYGCS